jgi:hypothetical protein
MNHLSFGRKEGRRLENKNTISLASFRVLDELYFDRMTGAGVSGAVES